MVGGVGLAVLLSLSRLVEYSLYPYAVVLQVTPVVAISPLLLIYLPQDVAVLACAWIVAFFPILSNTTLGLQSVDRNLLDLFDLYGATRPRGVPAFVGGFLARLKALWYLRRPAALPYFLAGLKIAGGLVSDRRRRRRDRGRLGRRRLRPRLPHRREPVPAQHPAPVRGSGALSPRPAC